MTLKKRIVSTNIFTTFVYDQRSITFHKSGDLIRFLYRKLKIHNSISNDSCFYTNPC